MTLQVCALYVCFRAQAERGLGNCRSGFGMEGKGPPEPFPLPRRRGYEDAPTGRLVHVGAVELAFEHVELGLAQLSRFYQHCRDVADALSDGRVGRQCRRGSSTTTRQAAPALYRG